MATMPQPQPQARTATAPPKTTPDYIVAAQKADATVLSTVQQNPIYKFIFEGEANYDQRITAVTQYLLAGLADSTAKAEDLDKRRQQLAGLNASTQVIRKQLGTEQAREITSKSSADFQRILNETSHDVDQFQNELAPLCELADLFTKFGAEGNIIEKINTAKQQKLDREQRLIKWSTDHDAEVLAFRKSISEIQAQITVDEARLASRWIGGAALEAKIANARNDLAERQQQLAEAIAKTPPEEAATNGDVEIVNEEILQLQNIGGEKFREAVTTLRDHTEEALAKISTNFDSAVIGLTNARESFITMDRNCSDATFALSVLEKAVQNAEAQSRMIAEKIVTEDSKATGDMAELEKMERQQRSEEILNYTAALTTFLTDLGIAVASLRSGQAVIKTILRMNATALESANTHKITGIANTADAVTITIGSIIDVCNRAASRALADGLTKMRGLAEQGSARLVGGTYEAIQQQNVQLQEFVTSVTHLKSMTQEISTNTIGMLKKQFDLVRQMREQSGELGDATTDAQRTTFAARAGVTTETPSDEPAAQPARFGLRVPHG